MALWRPWLVWGIGTVVLMGLFWLFAYGWGWTPFLDRCVTDMSCYCEEFDLAALRTAEASGDWWKGVQQPVNTYSNLYAIGTGLFVAWRLWRDRRPASNTNLMMSNWWTGDVWVFCVLFLGLGSMWFHGSISSSVSWFDSFSMYVFTGFMIFYTLDRGFAQHDVTPKTRTLVFWISYPSLVVLCTLIGIAGVPSEALIGITIGAYVVLEIVYGKFVFWPRWDEWVWKPFLLWFGGLLAFGQATLLRALATKPDDPWCTPDSFWQPHAFWHIYAGIMALCLYFYWREDRVGVGQIGESGGTTSSGGTTASSGGTVWT